MSIEQIAQLLWKGLLETLYMTVPATVISYLIGMPLGVLLVISKPAGILPRPTLHSVIGTAVNFLRSVPFIIFIIAIIPLTRFLVGKYIGPTAVIVPLTLAATPLTRPWNVV